MKKTKMVCTIGPKSESKEMLTKLSNAGMNVMRLNFSHGDYEEHGGRINTIREIMAEGGKRVAVLLDTKGPEIRTIKLQGGNDVALVAGQDFTLTTDKTVVGDTTKVAVTYEGLTKDLKPGNTVLLDDGLVGMTVKEVVGNEVRCIVNNNGDLGENKGVNLPGVAVQLPALAEKDIADLKFGCEQKVDFVAASFIRKADDVKQVRKENQEGLDNFDEILELSDGIMVARGDLGVEIPVEEVPFAQKMMIEKCNEAGKMVITATQMLDSMMKNPRPTRAEAGDVANAILDGTDAVMLSGESAKGKYPEIAVQTMAKICERTDKELDKYGAISYENEMTVTEAIARGAVEAAENLNAKAIIVLTESGSTARNIRKSFPTAKIIALTTNEITANQLMLSRGVYPVVVNEVKEAEAFFKVALDVAASQEFIQDGDIVVLTAGINSAVGTTNTIKVEVIKK